jgi:hypothetical protein
MQKLVMHGKSRGLASRLAVSQVAATLIEMVDLSNISIPTKADVPQTRENSHYRSLRITPFSMEVSGINGDHWDRLISKILPSVCERKKN